MLTSVPSTTGRSLVVIGTPDGAAKMFRAEGKYPLWGNLNVDWIYTKNNFITMVFS